MFSLNQKQEIAAKIEELLLSFNHPEMPKEKPVFQLKVYGKKSWSWADIRPNWMYTKENQPSINIFNELQANGEENK